MDGRAAEAEARVLEGPRTGKARITLRRTGQDTCGALLEMEAEYAPGGDFPPLHLHPQQDERFVVLEGAVEVRLGAVQRVFRAGQTLDIPRGTPHTFRAAGGAGARVNWQVRPALRTQAFYETLWGLAADGKTDAHGKPGLLQTALTLREFRREFVLCAPPPWVQRLLFPPLALLARALGLRPEYRRRAPVQAKERFT